MKKLLTACLAFSLFNLPAFATTSQLVDLVLEKRVMGDLHSGNRPMINPQHYEAYNFDLAPSQLNAKVSTVNQPVRGQALLKRYEVAPEPEHYQSLLKIYDGKTGAFRNQVSVGRRIQSLVASPHNNRLYVLCGGYFGSIWEIDTTRDMVVRKLPDFTPAYPTPPLWNPKNMVLMSDGQTLAVGSGKLQLIDLKNGQIKQELELPEGKVEVASLQALPGNALGVGLRDMQGGLHRYQLPANSRGLESGGGAAAGARALRVQVRTFNANPPAISRLFFMASRNSDYVRMVDRQTLATIGMLPVDFNVDDLVLSQDRKRLFVYNRRFGQVSVIELNTRAPETFSIIKRYQDKRFQADHPMQLGAAAGQVFLWDGDSELVAGFDTTTLYPRIGLPFGVRLNQPNEKVWVSMPAHQRFYLQEGKLYSEYMDQDPSALPQEIKLGAEIIDLQLSQNRRQVYVLTADTELIAIDASTHDIQQRLTLGLNPRYLSVASNDQRLFVIDADQGSVREIKTANFELVRELQLDVGRSQPYQITLYDPRLTQLIEVELPRYLTDVVRVTQ